MPRRVEKCLQIAPHSLAIVLDAAAGGRPGGDGAGGAGAGAGARAGPAAELGRHRIGYEIFADFKRENMQHFWDRRATAAVAETFFLGWIDEQVLLVQGKEEHLEVLRQGWARRSLKPPSGFHIKCLGRCCRAGPGRDPRAAPGHPPQVPGGVRERGRQGGPSSPRGFSSQKWVCAKGASRDGSGGITGMRLRCSPGELPATAVRSVGETRSPVPFSGRGLKHKLEELEYTPCRIKCPLASYGPAPPAAGSRGCLARELKVLFSISRCAETIFYFIFGST